MGCCGKTIKKAVGKALNIAVGSARYTVGIKYEWTDSRIAICRQCSENTWMTRTEYATWLLTHGIEVITNFTQLEKLPKLPKHILSKKRRNIYCRLCKCFIPSKARIEDEKCPLNKWQNLEGENKDGS